MQVSCFFRFIYPPTNSGTFGHLQNNKTSSSHTRIRSSFDSEHDSVAGGISESSKSSEGVVFWNRKGAPRACSPLTLIIASRFNLV